MELLLLELLLLELLLLELLLLELLLLLLLVVAGRRRSRRARALRVASGLWRRRAG